MHLDPDVANNILSTTDSALDVDDEVLPEEAALVEPEMIWLLCCLAARVKLCRCMLATRKTKLAPVLKCVARINTINATE